ncbi:MAG: NnrS family protein, partial [Myxococcota bacterium]
FGLVAAAVSGFLLTSVPVWTGQPPLVGGRLIGMVGLWIAGRVAMGAAGWIGPGWVAGIDLSFLPVLGVAVARPILRARSRRNYAVPLLLAVLAAANGMTHLEALGGAPLGRVGLHLGAYVLATLLIVIGGRITPAFTRNHLVRQGVAAKVRSHRWLERGLFSTCGGLLAAELLAPGSLLTGALELAVGGLAMLRLAGWQGLRVLREPLLWSLHLGQAWVAVGLVCTGIADLTGILLWSTGVHALTVGGFGTMLLAVMTRVGLAHTGRSLETPPGIPLAYGAITVAALIRVGVPIAWPAWGLEGIVVSGTLFAAAFGMFTWRYAPMLLAPRVDGGEG